MREEGGGGENAPTVEELKAQVAYANAGREGLDEKGLIRRERVRGLEDWIDKGRVKMSYMKFKSKSDSLYFSQQARAHLRRYRSSSKSRCACLDARELHRTIRCDK